MDFKRLTTILCAFSMMLLFTQCEKEGMIVKKEYPAVSDEAQNPHAKKPDNPPDQDETIDNYAIVSGLNGVVDIHGQGWFTTGGPFTLTLSGDHFDEWDAGTFTVTGYFGDPRTTLDDDAVRILYTTKKHGENRIDLWYADDDTLKCFVIRQDNPNDAYDPESNTLTFDGADCIVAIRDGTGEHYKDYTPASATVEISYEPLPE